MIIIPLIVLGVEIIGIIIYALVSSEWLANKYANKLENAWVFVDLGSHYKPVKGQMIYSSTVAETYAYKFEGKYREVTVPERYPVKYYKRRRIIYANFTKSVAISMPGGEPSIHKFSEEQLSSHHLEWSAVELVKTIKKQGFQLSGMMIVIGLIVIAAIVGGIIYFQSHKNSANKPATTTGITVTTMPSNGNKTK